MSRLFALIVFLILMPLFILVAILIIIEDGLPFFYIQKRVGLHGEEFFLFKFRSMKKNTPVVATNDLNEPEKYVTRVGKVIRKTSIDELLNLINIINGDLNFIGPRPILKSETELHDLREKFKIELKPGLTGLAQVQGRDHVTIEEKVKYDKYYQIHKGIKLNFFIISKTIYIVLFRKGILH
jgi:O-antigen biosynthesis protein WbqP